jgi:hypothetical protein
LPFSRVLWIAESPDTEIRNGMLSEFFYAPVSRDKATHITRNKAEVKLKKVSSVNVTSL